MALTADDLVGGASDWDAARARWLLQARPKQVTPPGDWNVWLLLAGRGFGKTLTAVEDVSDFCRRHPGVVNRIGPLRSGILPGLSRAIRRLPASFVVNCVSPQVIVS